MLGYPKSFTIYDRGDQESAARKALRDVRVPDSSLSPGDFLNIVSRWKTIGVNPDKASDYTENDLEFLAAVAPRWSYKPHTCLCPLPTLSVILAATVAPEIPMLTD